MGKVVTFVIALAIAAFLANHFGFVDLPFLDLPSSSEQTYVEQEQDSPTDSGQTTKSTKEKHNAIKEAFDK